MLWNIRFEAIFFIIFPYMLFLLFKSCKISWKFFSKNSFILSSHLILYSYFLFWNLIYHHLMFCLFPFAQSLNILWIFAGLLGCGFINDNRGTRRAIAICDFMSSSALKGVWAAQSSHLCAGHISAHLRYIHKSAHLLSLLLDLSPFVYVNLPLSLSLTIYYSLSVYLTYSLSRYLSHSISLSIFDLLFSIQSLCCLNHKK